jgi:hypothetical protein
VSKFQPVQFKSVEDFLLSLPPDELSLVQLLRETVLNALPGAMEKLSYNVPFFSRHGRICFIWPSSVPWGKVRPKGVQFGFCSGYLMRDELNWLDRGERKQVYSKTWLSPNEVEWDILRAYIAEAAQIDTLKSLERR